MWMMTGCRSGGCGEPNINNRDIHDYSIKAANLQPAVVLTPKLSATSNITQNSVLPFNHHHHHHHHQVNPVTPSEQGRSGSDYFYNDQQPAAAAVAPPRSSRWNPTPEQLLALEELYRRGIKTPTAQQIRQVTALLRHFGKIEGKNVFYWFQNHRARERQKRRRELMSSMSQSHSKEQRQQSWTNNLISSIQNKESAGGLKNLSLEGEQQNKWTLSNCISDQESSSVLQERMSMVESNSSKQPVDQSYSATQISQPPCANPTVALIDTKPLDYHHYYDYDYGMVLTAPHICKGEETRETRTLELFPLESDNLKGVKDSTLPQTKKDTTADFVADQYFQFL